MTTPWLQPCTVSPPPAHPHLVPPRPWCCTTVHVDVNTKNSRPCSPHTSHTPHNHHPSSLTASAPYPLRGAVLGSPPVRTAAVEWFETQVEGDLEAVIAGAPGTISRDLPNAALAALVLDGPTPHACELASTLLHRFGDRSVPSTRSPHAHMPLLKLLRGGDSEGAPCHSCSTPWRPLRDIFSGRVVSSAMT